MDFKSPFKPINVNQEINLEDHSEGAKKYIKSLLEEEDKKLKEAEMYPHGKPTDQESEFKQILPNRDNSEPLHKFNINIDRSKLGITQENWSHLLAQLFLEIFNAEKSLFDVSEQITGILSKQGIEANTDEIATIIESAQERIIKINVAKTLALAQGLHHEWDTILQRELDLIYPRRDSKNSIDR